MQNRDREISEAIEKVDNLRFELNAISIILDMASDQVHAFFGLSKTLNRYYYDLEEVYNFLETLKTRR